MRKIIVAVFILAQLALLLSMVGERELIVRNGQRVWLRTRPVDPRDLFRGDYVRLNYDLSSLSQELWSEALRDSLQDKSRGARSLREQTLYVTLQREADGLAAASGVDLQPPAAGALFIRGVQQYGRWGGRQEKLPKVLNNIRYGIESYYVEQGKGMELELGRPEGLEGNMRVPLEIEVAIGKRGDAVILGHRWANVLAIGHVRERIKDAEAGNYELLSLLVYRSPTSDESALLLPADLRTLSLSCYHERIPLCPDSAEELAARPLTQEDIRVIPPFQDGDELLKIPVARYKDSHWLSADGGRVLGRSENSYHVAIVYDARKAAAELPAEMLEGLCRRRLISDNAWWSSGDED